MKRREYLIGFLALLVTCTFPPDSSLAQKNIYFPHVARGEMWEAEICIINTSNENNLNGELIAYNNKGQSVHSSIVKLSPRARKEIVVGKDLASPGKIGYIIFESDLNNVCGYTKLFVEGKYRAAIPALSEINTGNIYIPHIASNSNWWTGISLLNTTSSAKKIAIEFDNGNTITRTIAGKEHQAFTIKSLFEDNVQPDINSAVIKNGYGIVGLELFGSYDGSGNNYLSGILLKDDTKNTIYYPHIPSNSNWWTGIVAYNPSDSNCTLKLTPYKNDGTVLAPQTILLDGYKKYIATVPNLNLPVGTAWFSVKATNPIAGFELFGTKNGKLLGGYAGGGGSGTDGIFAKIEKNSGWTGIALINIEESAATVTMTALDDGGNSIATKTLNIGAYSKVVGLAQTLFAQNINNATYISYSSNKNVVGFQLNGSSDGMLLDSLPVMKVLSASDRKLAAAETIGSYSGGAELTDNTEKIDDRIPQNLKLIDPLPNDSIKLVWDAAPGAKGYYVYWSWNSPQTILNPGPLFTNNTYWIHTDLVPGHTYFFSVTAVFENDWESDFSNMLIYSSPNING